jgi:hypothetical protein
MWTRWTEAERRFVYDNAAYLTDKQLIAALARLTGRVATRDQIQRLRVRLGIEKDRGGLTAPLPEYRSSPSG